MDTVKTGKTKIQETTLNTLNVQTQTPAASLPQPAVRHSPLRQETKDVLKALNSSLQQLEDLSGRLGYVLGEIRGLIRR